MVLWGQPRRPVKQGFGERCWRRVAGKGEASSLRGTGGEGLSAREGTLEFSLVWGGGEPQGRLVAGGERGLVALQ